MKRLPKLPSKLLLLALDDLAEVEALPQIYEVAMGVWHQPPSESYGNKRCVVCLAGSVMARSLDLSPFERHEPEHLDNDDLMGQLWAIDHLREGRVMDAVDDLGIQLTKRRRQKVFGLHNEYCHSVVDYAVDRGEFKRTMRRLTGRLEEIGL